MLMPYQHFLHVPTLWRSLKQPQTFPFSWPLVACELRDQQTNSWNWCFEPSALTGKPGRSWEDPLLASGKWKQKSTFILSCFLKKYVSDPSGEVKEREPEKEEGTPILHMSNWYCGGQKKRSKETHAHWLTGVSNMKTLMLGQFILCTPRKGASSCAFCWGFHIKKTPPIGRKACALDGIKKHSTPFEHSCLMFQCSPQGQPPEPMWFHRSFRYHLDSFKQVQDSNKFWSYEIVLTS